MGHVVKRGDTKTLKWSLGRDLSAVDSARVVIARDPGVAPAVNRMATIESPATGGEVSLVLEATDYGTGKLVPGRYVVEVETLPGPLTHPDSGYEYLWVVADLG